MKKENILVIALICIAVGGIIIYRQMQTRTETTIQETSASDAISWQEFKTGFKGASEKNKPIFLYFYADWCTYCTKLKQTTFRDKNVLAFLNEHFISIRVNTDIDKQLAANWQIRGLPTMWFLEPDSTRINSIPGYVNEEQFLTVLKFIQTRSYKNMTLQEFVKSI